MKIPFLLTLALLLSFNSPLFCQIKEITFGEIPNEDLVMAVYKEDLSADAVVLDDYCQVALTSYDNIVVVSEHHIRVKIINTEGLDYANIEIPYGIGDKVTGIRAATYNLENGEILVNAVEKKGFYFENTSRYRQTLRFTMPNVRVGSVIEYKYTLESPSYFSLCSMEFQQEIPVRVSGLRVEIPGYFEYKFIPRGSFSNVKYSKREGLVRFGGRTVDGFVGQWYAYNMPASREEPFSTGSGDYYTSLGFELSKINFPGIFFEDISPTYPNLSRKLLERDDFGGFYQKNSFLKEKTEEIISGAGSETEKVRRIHRFVADQMMWNGINDYTASGTLKKVFNDEKGNTADINLMLLAMLRIAGISSEPVILSTREHGSLNPFFAIIQQFDYVAVIARADGEQYVIDATDPLRPFNLLPFYCLNGDGWALLGMNGSWVAVRNDERYQSSINLEMNLKGDGSVTGHAVNSYESYDAFDVRKICRLEGTDAYTDYIRYLNNGWKISDLKLENLANNEEPLAETFNFSISDAADINGEYIYLLPVQYDKLESNPYYSEERISPVDLGCPSEQVCRYRITVPDDYEVQEMPLNMNTQPEGGGAEYKYTLTRDGRIIILETELKFSDFRFNPERYNAIRDFYARIIQKQSEVIILKRKQI
jgi:hypothetical protein